MPNTTKPFNKVSVIGAGSFGTAIANYIAKNPKKSCHSVILYGRDPDTVESINTLHINDKRLPGYPLEHNLKATTSLEEALKGSDLVVPAVPSQFIRQLILDIKPFISSDTAILNLAKGMEKGTHLRMSEVIYEAIGNKRVPLATLSGPSFAQDIVAESPIGITIGSKDKKLLNQLYSCLNSPSFDVKITTDLAGLEIGGALKNIFSIVAGVFAGCGLGSSIMGDYFTRSMVEMRDIGMFCGGRWSTFSGRSGLGDLVVTCNEPSRNFRFGRTYAEMYTIAESRNASLKFAELHHITFKATISALNTRTIEGYDTIEPIHYLVKQNQMFAPIIQSAYELFYGKRYSPIELLSRIRTIDRTRKRDGLSVFSIFMHEFFPKLWYRRKS